MKRMRNKQLAHHNLSHDIQNELITLVVLMKRYSGQTVRVEQERRIYAWVVTQSRDETSRFPR